MNDLAIMDPSVATSSSSPTTTTIVDSVSDLQSLGLLYRSHHSLKVGGVHRFIINYIPHADHVKMEKIPSLFVKIKNVEMLPMRAAFLVGPFILYCDIKPADFDHNKKCFITADQPTYNPNLSAGQSLVTELSTHTIKGKYVWVVDVISQMIFSSSADIHFEIMIGTKKASLHRRNFKDTFGTFTNEIVVERQDTLDLWNKPPPLSNEKPVHLVILTHGLLSNSTADLFYIKDQIETYTKEHKNENIIVRCFPGNVCKTERGVKYLGRRLAEHIIHEICKPELNIKKISFVAHSLGGLVQTFAIAYIDHNYPDFFKKIEPINFITMASPLLGITNENPAYVNIALSAGIVGKTGQDLGLQGFKPLLMLLPSKPTRKILRKFKRRTIYANALNDGIVPLRTAALLYLDWKGLSKVHDLITHANSNSNSDPTETPNNHSNSSNINGVDKSKANEDGDTIEEIPEESQQLNSADDTSGSIQNLKNKIISPLNYVMSLMVPNLQAKEKGKRYQRYQTKDEETDDFETYINPLPKSSIIASATKVLLPPLPPLKFLVDPSTRPQTILHDKVYHPESIPKISRKSSTFIQSIDPIKRQRALEEEIARRWHKGLSWRKVIVNLLPDAHNNIVVRRRFANAYGWPVVQHMIENHFALSDDIDQDEDNVVSNSDSDDEEGGEHEEGDDGDILKNDENDNDDKLSDGEDSDEDLVDRTNSEKLTDILEFQHQKVYHKKGSSASNRTGTRNFQFKKNNTIFNTNINTNSNTSIDSINRTNSSSNDESRDSPRTRETELSKKIKKSTSSTSSLSTELNRNKYETDSESEEETLGWLNDDPSEYYDGPTGTLSNMQETMNERLDAWKQTLYSQLDDGTGSITYDSAITQGIRTGGSSVFNYGNMLITGAGQVGLSSIKDIFANALSGGLLGDIEDDYTHNTEDNNEESIVVNPATNNEEVTYTHRRHSSNATITANSVNNSDSRKSSL